MYEISQIAHRAWELLEVVNIVKGVTAVVGTDCGTAAAIVTTTATEAAAAAAASVEVQQQPNPQ